MSPLDSDFSRKYGPWALVCGASDGIGEAFAHQLAAAGSNVVLMARREEVLRELASTLEGELANRGAYTSNVLSKLGLHKISCSVTDRHGDSVTSDSVTVHVINLDPRIASIRAKRDATGGSPNSFSSADVIRLEATIDDPDGFPIEDAKVEWSSSVDGDLPQTGATMTTAAQARRT